MFNFVESDAIRATVLCRREAKSDAERVREITRNALSLNPQLSTQSEPSTLNSQLSTLLRRRAGKGGGRQAGLSILHDLVSAKETMVAQGQSVPAGLKDLLQTALTSSGLSAESFS